MPPRFLSVAFSSDSPNRLFSCLVACALLGIAACGSSLEQSTDAFTAVSAVASPTPEAPSSAGGPGDTLVPDDANIIIAAPGPVIGAGFSLQATASPNLCLASAHNPPQANDTLNLAPCAATESQAFSWYKGGFALSKRFCVTSPGPLNANVFLQVCTAGAAQVWQLSGATNLMTHSIASTFVSNQTLGLFSANAGAAATSVDVAAANTLRVNIATLPGTAGFRVHALVSGADLCLTDTNQVLTAVACDGNQGAAQLWQWSGDQLKSVVGHCLLANTSTNTASLATCQATPPAAQKWYVMNFFLSPMAPTSTMDSTSLALDVDVATKAVRLAPYNGVSPVFSLGAPAFF